MTTYCETGCYLFSHIYTCQEHCQLGNLICKVEMKLVFAKCVLSSKHVLHPNTLIVFHRTPILEHQLSLQQETVKHSDASALRSLLQYPIWRNKYSHSESRAQAAVEATRQIHQLVHVVSVWVTVECRSQFVKSVRSKYEDYLSLKVLSNPLTAAPFLQWNWKAISLEFLN